MRHFILKQLALDLYKSLVDPHFRYCNYIYSRCSLSNQRKLQVAQNNSLRAVAKVDPMYSTDALHKDLSIDWLDITAQKSLCVEMFKNIHGMNPTRNCSLVNWVTHERELRSTVNAELNVGCTKTKLGDMNMFIRGPKAWHQLPVHMQKCDTLSGFKRAVKGFDGFSPIR